MKLPKIMLLILHDKEREILKLAFEQRGIEVLALNSVDYNAYLKTVQFEPDIIIVQIPKYCIDQERFLESLQKNKRTSKIYVIAYFSTKDKFIANNFSNKKIIKKTYHRPLKFSVMLPFILNVLKNKGKELDVKEKLTEEQRDILKVFDKQVTKENKIEIIASYSSEKLAFPQTITKVLEISNDPNKGASDLSKVIKSDPTISFYLLKIANSVLYSRITRKISDVKEAIVRIGINETKRLAMSIKAMDLFSGESYLAYFNKKNFWIHSLLTAIIAEKLSGNFMSAISPNESFIGGLLHDLPLIIFDNFFSPFFKRVLKYTIDKQVAFENVVRKLIGFQTNTILQSLFKTWQFPSILVESSGEFRSKTYINEILEKNSKGEDLEDKEILVLILYFSEIFAKALNIGSECDFIIPPISNELLKALKLSVGIKEDLLDKIFFDLKMYNELLKLEIDFHNEEEKEKKVFIVNFTNELFVPIYFFLKVKFRAVLLKSDKIEEAKTEIKDNYSIFWTNKDSNVEEIQNLTKELDLSKILIMGDKRSNILKFAVDNKIGHLYRECDYRLLEGLFLEDRSLQEIIPIESDLNDIEALREELLDLKEEKD